MADTRGEPPAPGGAGSDTCPGGTPALGRGLDTLLTSGIEAATVVAMLLQVGSVAAGVFCRYVLHRPLAGADEVATLGLVWLTFLGGAVAQRRHAHPRVSLGLRRLASAAWVDASTRLTRG